LALDYDRHLKARQRKVLAIAAATVLVIVVVVYLWRREVCDSYRRDLVERARRASEVGVQQFEIEEPPWGCSFPTDITV
jgi:hypothetical protein